MTVRQRVEATFRQHGLALAFFVLTVGAVNYPLLAHLGTHVIGRSFEDVFEVLWQLSWMEKALFEQHVNPFYVPEIYYPKGWYLASGAQPAWYILMLSPLSRLLGAVLTYNLTQLATLVVAGFGAYLLAFHITRSRWAGTIAGLTYILAPIITLRLGGHLHTLLSVHWLPYAYLSLFRSLEARGHARFRWAAAAGLLLALTILGHWSFLFTATLPVIGALLYHLRRHAIRSLSVLAISAAICLLILAPFVALTWHARQQMFPGEGQFPLFAVDAGSLSPDRLFVPNPNHGLWGFWSREHFPVAGEQDAVALGYTATILAGVALALAPQKKTALPLSIAAVALVLALGTSLHWGGQPVLVNNGRLLSALQSWLLPGLNYPGGRVGIPMPASLLYKYLPFYDAMRVPARFTIPLVLMVGVLAGTGFQQLAARLGERRARYLGVVLAGLVIMEGWLAPYPAFTGVATNDRPQLVQWLKQLPDESVLVEYPPAVDKMAVYSQSAHGLAIVNGYMSVEPSHISEVKHRLGQWPSEDSLSVLRAWDVNYVIINGYGDRAFEEAVIVPLSALEALCLVKVFDEGFMDYTRTYVFSLDEEAACPGRR